VMKEYYKKPEETKSTLKNGWLYSGDLATIDE
jgi:long-subunit acyl-CoA synthetase (AMP-forming)